MNEGSDGYVPSIESNETAAKEVYLEAVRSGYGPIVAARAINTTQAEMDRYVRLDESFARRVEEAQQEAIERIESKVKESAQAGDLVAAKLVLETHKPEQWMKPEREVLLKLGAAEEIDVPALHERLKALDRGDVIDVESEEVVPDE